jgi:large subunit ribosomal protein L30
MPGKLRVTQVRSTISHIGRNRATVRALGLHGIGSSVEIPDNEATRGMVRQVRFLVSFEEIEATAANATPAAKATVAAKATPAAKRGAGPSAEETK